MSFSITALSNLAWLQRRSLKMTRYLRRFHKREDRPVVADLIVHNPDEGRKLIENFSLSDAKKKEMLLEWLYFQPQITSGIFADQRMGKDALICKVFEDVIAYCKENKFIVPRFVTLNNLRNPPFVDEEDMYFSFRNIPVGRKGQQVWIYCSEIETVLPAREGKSPENKLFSQLEGTMAQNHQKLFGCSKLASKVDLNFIRGMNCKFFKYISQEKLCIEGVERERIVSPLGNWLLPKDKLDRSRVLMCFDDQLLTVNYPLPSWWSDEYSEQFKDVPLDKIKDYVEVQFSNGMTPPAIRVAVAQKFRVDLSQKQIQIFCFPLSAEARKASLVHTS
jgi:hypothetical protein